MLPNVPRPHGKGSLGHRQQHNRVVAVPPHIWGQPHHTRAGLGAPRHPPRSQQLPLSPAVTGPRLETGTPPKGGIPGPPPDPSPGPPPHPPHPPVLPHPAEPRGNPGTRLMEDPHRVRGRARCRRRGAPRDELGGDEGGGEEGGGEDRGGTRGPRPVPRSDAERGPTRCGVTAVTSPRPPAAMALGAAGHEMGEGNGGGVEEGVGEGIGGENRGERGGGWEAGIAGKYIKSGKTVFFGKDGGRGAPGRVGRTGNPCWGGGSRRRGPAPPPRFVPNLRHAAPAPAPPGPAAPYLAPPLPPPLRGGHLVRRCARPGAGGLRLHPPSGPDRGWPGDGGQQRAVPERRAGEAGYRSGGGGEGCGLGGCRPTAGIGRGFGCRPSTEQDSRAAAGPAAAPATGPAGDMAAVTATGAETGRAAGRLWIQLRAQPRPSYRPHCSCRSNLRPSHGPCSHRP